MWHSERGQMCKNEDQVLGKKDDVESRGSVFALGIPELVSSYSVE